MQTHHAKNLQTMSPSSFILRPSRRNVVFFVPSVLNRKFICDEETQSSGSK
jgi:hypothetical protein